ncbi:MAG TPA: hypothetical protein VIP11_18120, partial [Gemmatimonadaceae bacterium]
AARATADARTALYDLDNADAFREQVKARMKSGGSLGELLSGFDLTNFSTENITRIKQAIREFFETLTSTPEALDLAGLSVEDLIAILMDFDSALDGLANTAASAAQKLYQSSNDLAHSWEINGTSSVDQIYQQAHAFKIDNFEMFDLNTQEGREAAKKWVKGVFNTAVSQEEADHMYTLWKMINALPGLGGDMSGGGGFGGSFGGGGSTSAIAAGFQSLTTMQGDRLGDLMLRSTNFLDSISINVADIREMMAGTVRMPRYATVDPSAAAAASGGGGGITIGSLEVRVVSNAEDAQAQGREIAQAFADEMRRIDASLGRRVLVQRRNRGDIRVTPS